MLRASKRALGGYAGHAGLAIALVIAGCSASRGVGSSGEGASASTIDGGSPSPGTSGDDSKDANAPSSDATSGGAHATDDAGGGNEGDAADDANVGVDAAREGDAAPPDLGLDCSPGAAGAISSVTGAPLNLGCTGLYGQWPTRAIAANVASYDPGIHLWSDGAEKHRYIALPPGTKIDTSNMDEWTFPVGTKAWKEFLLDGKKIETRFLWKQSETNWVKTTYRWSDDESTATEVTDGAWAGANGTYEVPSLDRCTTCHMGRQDWILGFEAVSLSTPAATGLTMNQLVAKGLLTNPPSAPITIPGNATQVAALGWLHANCGTACHNRSPNAYAGSTGMWLRLEVAKMGSVNATDAITTTVGIASGYQPPGESGFLRIKPGDSSHSCIPYRDGTRDPNYEGNQMPPIDTHTVDTAGVASVKAWIDSMPAQ